MSLDNEGLAVTWEDIKEASRRLDWGGKEVEEKAEKRVARRYLSETDCDDARVREHLAVPGYN
ncbi:MAG: hypothetical protein H6959_04995 [Chromatiaceae bacterium]|nr:hypothetical protein [Gammaproteobacteria bacterium]MCP5300180.1 hypothetical protein [Chromatiaceae bacterium]MCP5422252.1 hypothetical protein [Chromatiaceae bacterium]